MQWCYVMVSTPPGVGKLRQSKLQHREVIIWHSLNHRLELTVHDCNADIMNDTM